MKRNFGIIFIIIGVVIVIAVLYGNSRFARENRTFSPYTVLTSSWEKYKIQFINKDGRVIDYSQNGITTSEGQSYALLRAVWIDDKDTFDLVWKWTSQTLKRKDDNLFGWQWGKNKDGKYGFITDGGDNTASDADSDIALALVFAGKRWGDSHYTDSAKSVLNDLWKVDTDTVANKRYLVAGNWAKSQNEIVLNPSYFSPYAWRIFANIDSKHDWNSLISPAYDLLSRTSVDPLDKSKAVGLPPDWVSLDRTANTLKAPHLNDLTTDYSFDAVRTPWRIGLDYQWNKDPRAKAYLENAFRFLSDSYSKNKKLGSIYAHDGEVINGNENPVMYATAIGYFLTVNPDLAKSIYEDKIIKLYSNDKNSFNKDLPYYEQNWLWFGAALYNKALVAF